MFDFRNWILNQINGEYSIVKENDDVICLETDYGIARIVFTRVNEGEIVEFTITSNKDQSVKFYLHFELNDEEHARGLYQELVDSLLALKDNNTLSVLLSCSSGLTTSMFAEQLNSTVNLLGLDYHFDAVAYSNIYDNVEDYDMVLIAPQIGYLLNRLKDSLNDHIVEQIPTSAFASYDSMSVIKFIQELLEQEKEIEDNCTCCCYENKKRILAISIVNSKKQTTIDYRLYYKGSILDSKKIIKCKMDINDLYDIIDTVLLRYDYIDMIGIATPGIVKDEGLLVNPVDEDDIYEIKKEFEKRYNIGVCVINSANAAAMGFSLENSEYKQVVFLSQPFGFAVGGIGMVIDGKVINGKNGIAGEVKYFIRRMQLSDDPHKLVRSEQGALELISKELLPILVTIGPDVVAISSSMVPNMEELAQKLSSFIPEEFLPKFVYVKDSSSYMLNGITQLCLNKIKKD